MVIESHCWSHESGESPLDFWVNHPSAVLADLYNRLPRVLVVAHLLEKMWVGLEFCLELILELEEVQVRGSFGRPFCLLHETLYVCVREVSDGVLRVFLVEKVVEEDLLDSLDELALLSDDVQREEEALGPGLPIWVHFRKIKLFVFVFVQDVVFVVVVGPNKFL